MEQLKQLKEQYGIRDFDELLDKHPRAFKVPQPFGGYRDVKTEIDERWTSRESAFVIPNDKKKYDKYDLSYNVHDAEPLSDGTYLEVATVELRNFVTIKLWMKSYIELDEDGDMMSSSSDWIGWSE